MPAPIGFDMTPATRALDAAGVVYSIHVFEHDPAVRDYGREAADAIGADHDQVFKTLVVVVDGALAVAILPVSCQLSMKRAGRRARCQASRDVRHDARRTHHRATSPAASARSASASALATVIDESAELYDTIYVSGGRRGLDLGVAPGDLVAAGAWPWRRSPCDARRRGRWSRARSGAGATRRGGGAWRRCARRGCAPAGGWRRSAGASRRRGGCHRW